MDLILPPQATPPVALLLRFLRAGVSVSLKDAGTLTWIGARGVFHQLHGYFDKDEQQWVSYVDADVSEAAAAGLLQASSVADLRLALSEGYNALALDAWLRADPGASAFADAARAWQDDQPVVAWGFAQVFQALARVGAGQPAEALALLQDVDDLTLWHALATLHGYRSDPPHMVALWAVCAAFAQVGRPYPSWEQEAATRLRAAGVAEADWRPSGHPGVSVA